MKNKIVGISLSVLATALLIGGLGAISKGFRDWTIKKDEVEESSKEEEKYDYNSTAEFEDLYINNIWAEDGIYREEFAEELSDLVVIEPVDLNSINLVETLGEYNVGVFDGAERHFFYIDDDIFTIKGLDYPLYFFQLDDSHYIRFSADSFDLCTVAEDEKIYKDSLMKNTFVTYTALILIGIHTEVRKNEFKYKELNLPSKKMNGFIFSSYVEYSDYFDENNEPIWMDYEELGLISNLKINFENERIQLTSSQYESLFSHIGDYKLSEYQLTHIEVIEK